ncbi:MAG: 2OG-Fe(II) oxygenase [Proteobacteria bacterium]|nr:2OG-Fe(II) oxygenase [Pseudomonadota bacterium]
MKFNIDILKEPFPHIIVKNFYSQDELDLIWEELNFLNKPGKLQTPEQYHSGMDESNEKYLTSHRALTLDFQYASNRNLSNILTVSQKLFDHGILNLFANEFRFAKRILYANYSYTKVRYYHDKDEYQPHEDLTFEYLAFSYFNKLPKKFIGGELYFPEYGDYQFNCENNSLILFPSYVIHGVKKVEIKDSDYFSGYGRYAITHFFGHRLVEDR